MIEKENNKIVENTIKYIVKTMKTEW